MLYSPHSDILSRAQGWLRAETENETRCSRARPGTEEAWKCLCHLSPKGRPGPLASALPSCPYWAPGSSRAEQKHFCNVYRATRREKVPPPLPQAFAHPNTLFQGPRATLLYAKLL